MTIGNELDQAFYNLGQRLNRLEKKEVTYPIENDFGGRITEVETKLTEHIVRVAAQSDPTERIAELVNHEVNERINGDIAALESRVSDFEDDMNFDPDDLRCDFESQIEEVRDSVMYADDRLDEVEAYKITEEEAEYIVDRKLDDRAYEIRDAMEDELMDRVNDYVEDAVCEEINSHAVSWTEHRKLQERVLELEARLNKPSFTARALRWLRKGPSIKELATKWYASLRRARV